MDNANALKKILEGIRTSAKTPSVKGGRPTDVYYSELARVTSKSESYIRGIIHLSEEDEEIKRKE